MANQRPPYARRVGLAIAARRAELGLTQGELAARIEASVSPRTLTNVETGATAILPRLRPAWDRALEWPAGTINRAYHTGKIDPTATDDLGWADNEEQPSQPVEEIAGAEESHAHRNLIAAGTAVAARREEMGLTQGELAARIAAPVSTRTVTNVESGSTAVPARLRPVWDEALEWPVGTLDHLYRTGTRPSGKEKDADGRGKRRSRSSGLLERAGVPAEHHGHQDVAEILDSTVLGDADKVALLRMWTSQHRAFRETVDLVISKTTSTAR
ncbi:helix-turn-helix domain-containing protein [Micromonospora sp. WMMD1102]|uniref:helix-turn-helix domain-containing protein n=1 Tax=Micromonospora sp. WMMD1102 TaxID=3016105 RepID=UPI0024159245|nr:helix-turn-helix domain-containing protein [Micromonospora sp. WMMD1102]MDG4787118.1 helix-turn-helix domain-containing protein [Micromonospora sp. WMMD1102]